MKPVPYVLFAALLFVLSPPAAHAQEPLAIGGDNYIAGTAPELDAESPRDAFAAGVNVSLKGKVESDAHAMGLNVDIDAPVGEDLYAAGFSVTIERPVGGDLTASGFSVDVRRNADVAGNTRLAGGVVTLDAPVAGSLVASGGTLKLNSAISGDASIVAGDIEFGPDARIDGTLSYRSPEPIDIPSSVINPDRVRFKALTGVEPMREIERTTRGTFERFWPSTLGVLFAFLVTLAFLVVVAAALLAMAPRTVERLREETISRPWSSLAFGFLGLATLFGLVPVSAITLIGIPLVPVVLLAIILLWIASYLLGTYALSWRVLRALRPVEPTMVARLAAVTVGIVILALLNFVPFLGWLINLAVILLGLGGITAHAAAALVARRTQASSPRQDTDSHDDPSI